MTEQSEDADTPPRRRRRWWIPLAVLLGVLLAAGGGLLIYANSLSDRFAENLQRGGEVQLPPPPESSSGGNTDPSGRPAGPKKSVDFVLMGVDQREGDRGRSDSLMLAHLTGDRKQLYLISFPRDMWVPIPDHGNDKINAAYAYGGTALTVRTMQDLLGIQVDHVAMIDMEGFIRLTDAVGGVTVTNDHEFSRDGFDFPKGQIELAGEKALAFVRERKQLPNGDLDRARNQRLVLRAIIDKALAPGMLANPAAFGDFVEKVAGTMHVDETMTPDRVQELFLSLRMTPSGIHELQAPIKGFGTSPGGASIDVVDMAQLAELGEALANDTMAEYYERYHNS